MVDRSLEIKRLFKAADCRAEVAKFDVNLGFLNIDLRNRLVVEKNFIKFYKCLLQVVFFERLFSLAQPFQNLFLSNSREFIFLKQCQ